MIVKLYKYRFEILLFTQLAILFGGLLFPSSWFDNYISPILFILNLLAALVLFSSNKKKMWLVIVLLLVAIIAFGIDVSESEHKRMINNIKLVSFFLFYVLLAMELVQQVWSAKKVEKNVIFGLISGYLSIGLIGFFICLSIELYHPGAFKGLNYLNGNSTFMSEDLIYYSYVTLMTIGYGDIVPVTPLAKKAAVLIGLLGQFYLVILTAVIVGKYINQKK
jgi:voltage-gated potassium channel